MKRLLSPLSMLALTAVSHGVILQLDYSYDAANGNFFGTNTVAKAALDAAAADLSAALLPSFDAVATEVFTGRSGETEATFNWRLSFENPFTGATVTLENFAPVAADVVTIYVGMRPLTGSTLGEGGPGGAGFSLNGSGFPAEWVAAVDEAEAASNAVMPREGGPVIGSISGSSTFGSAVANYTMKYGQFLGNLWFDNDTNNDGAIDSESTLNNSWHFSHLTTPATGKNDFYSVALHELIHGIGFGSSDTWDSFESGGTNWLGPNARSLDLANGVALLSPDGAHIREGYVSPRLSDGVLQEVVMDPTVTVGTRKLLTEMDVAFLRDLGYATVPEPGVPLLSLAGLAWLAAARRPRRA